MLVIRGLTRAGLEPFDFDLADGECVSVRGPSGGGKTAIFRVQWTRRYFSNQTVICAVLATTIAALGR